MKFFYQLYQIDLEHSLLIFLGSLFSESKCFNTFKVERFLFLIFSILALYVFHKGGMKTSFYGWGLLSSAPLSFLNPGVLYDFSDCTRVYVCIKSQPHELLPLPRCAISRLFLIEWKASIHLISQLEVQISLCFLSWIS